MAETWIVRQRLFCFFFVFIIFIAQALNSFIKICKILLDKKELRVIVVIEQINQNTSRKECYEYTEIHTEIY